MNQSLPTGTVTFLFTDVEGSSQLWEHYPEAMKPALARHDDLLRRAIEAHHGRVVKTTGDGCHAVFAVASDALAAVLAAQREMATTEWPTTGLLNTDILTTDHRPLIRVRMGLHTGEAEMRDSDYFGSAVNRAARIMSIGHGGQALLSAATASLVTERLPQGASLLDLGEHRLRDLSHPERIYQLVAADLPANFPPLRSLDAFPGNLPIQLTSFIGRERELSEVKRLLASSRLLTLTGPGGTGKTRLSLQVAADLHAEYAHGAWLVELAPLADPALIPAAVAGVFTLNSQPGLSMMAVLTDYLRGKQLLLILDNCEHLVEACARLAADLLPVCPRLTILASSREGLGVPGETTFHVPTLNLPERTDTTAAAICRYDAADLFLQRARAALPTFAVTDGNAAVVGQIVRRLDGIPLAIELAAARVRMLSPEQIAARLDDRFRLLTGGSRTALPRQQTLRALIDWSYDLLDEGEKWFFRLLGVFVGGWTLEAAEAVATSLQTSEVSETSEVSVDVLDLLAGLINKSLVLVEEGNDGTRYRYLETIRQYARDKLFESGEGEAARDQHMDYFDRTLAGLGLIWLEDGVGHFSMTAFFDVSGWISGLEQDVENLRAAIRWAIGRDPDRALLMATTFSRALESARNLSENASIIEEALSVVEGLPEAIGETAERRVQLRALAYLALGNHLLEMGDMTEARADYGQAERLARESDNRPLLARALVQHSLAAGFQNDDAAFAYGDEAAALYRELGDPLGVAQALGQLVRVYLYRGDLTRAASLAEESGSAMRSSNSPYAGTLNYLLFPMLARFLGDIPSAEAQYRAGVAEFRRLGNRGFAAVMQSDLGHMLRQAGRRDEALIVYRDTIREWQDLGRRAAVANMLENFAFMARAEGQPDRAARLLGAAEAIRDEIQVDMTPWEREEYEREVAALREVLPDETFAAEWAAGRGLTLDEAVDFAVA
jgi:predicted ATPase/class 3 adenylate cyclase